MPNLHSLRTDLEFSNQNQQGKSFVVVKDPVTEKYFRFTETQAFIFDEVRSPLTSSHSELLRPNASVERSRLV